MKILVSQFCHETNTFAVDRTDIERFKKFAYMSGEAVLNTRKGGTDYISGMLSKAEELGVELIPGFSAFGVGGLILKETYEDIKKQTLNALVRHKGEYEGVCLSLHGAASSENIDDLELDFVSKVREIVGKDMPVTASFDLHGNISKEMVDMLDGVFTVKEYPHIDCDKMGALALDTLVRIIRGETKTFLVHKSLKMMIPPATACTFYNPALKIKEHIAKYKEEKGIIDISFFHGFPYADLSITGSSIVVTAPDKDSAETAAKEISHYIWNMRKEFDAKDYLNVVDALDKAIAIEGKPIVINETSDNPGGGTPADGTHLLRELLKRDLPDTCFGFIYDPGFVALCAKAGVGNKVSGLLGAKTDKIHGEPIEVKDALVKKLTDGRFISKSPVFNKGAEISMGDSALIRAGNVDVIIGSVRMQTLDDALFLLHDINISDYKIVALKSTQHFRAVFDAIAKAIVTADPPGIHTANFSLLSYKKLTRPLYPLDQDFDFV